MAEIRIERKRRSLGWLWLLLALVVVAVLAWYFLYPGRTATAPAAAPPTTGAVEPGAPAAYRVVATSRLQADDSPGHLGGWYGQQG